MAYAPNSLAARDIAYLLHPYTNLGDHEQKGPLIITRGEGIYVWDEDGNRYLEGLAGLWCTGLGFSEPRLVEAATRQLQTLPYSHIFAHRSTPPIIELAEKLIKIAPKPLGKVFFANSGSEATDSVVKFVWYYNNAMGRPNKKKIIARKRGYHGVTVAAASMTGLPPNHNDWDLPIARILHTDTPCPYRNALPGESEDAFSDRLAANLEKLIQDEGPDTVAAFIAEPVMGAGGVIVPPRGYFEKIQAVLKRYDILMVADEVICGFGRTGNMWGSQTFGITPDLLTCAKQLTSAYIPMSAVLVSDALYGAFVEQSRKLGNLATGFTYGGHPVAAAVGVETLKIYEERDIIGHVRKVAPAFQRRIRECAEHPLVGHTRGVGLVGGLEIVADKASKRSFPPELKVSQMVAAKALKHGLIVRGLPNDAVGICPPLIITETEIHDLFDRLHRALDDTLHELKKTAAAA
ncbi:MAG: aspartate aminotransferase family protein [Gammaproteobacteria bacterium]